MATDLLKLLEGKWDAGKRPADLYARYVAAKPAPYVGVILSGLDAKDKRVQNGCAELASLLSAEHPGLLYPHAHRFVANLKAKAPVLRWEAACTVGNLAAEDDAGVIAKQASTLIAMLAEPSIVLQGHAVRALAKLALKHGALAPTILDALVAAEEHFPATRVGYLIEATEAFVSHAALRPALTKFLTPHAASARAPVARKAHKALKKLAAAGKR